MAMLRWLSRLHPARWVHHVLAYLHLEAPRPPETPPPEPVSYAGFKLMWFALGLGVLAWVLTADALAGMPAEARRMLAVAAPMALWWITEAVPVSITALVPLVALPTLGISNARAAAAPYADPNVFLFIGGFMLASCMERWGLHKRLALHILLAVGTSPRRILLGCMAATAFLSAWVSNTATVLMMFPIAMALVDRGTSPSEADRHNFTVSLLLAVAYAGSMGGVATLIGTPPNIVFASLVRRLGVGSGVSFLQWMQVGVPVSLVMLTVVYLVLTRLLFRFDQRTFATDTGRLREELRGLGPLSRGEAGIAVMFSLTALLWITRKDVALGALVLPGWSRLLPFGANIHDGTVAIFMAGLLFVLPVDWRRGLFLMDREWHKGIPWDIVLLFGGGFSLAEGFQSSGLSAWLGESLGFLHGLPVPIMLLVVCLFVTFLTELTSNTATTTVLLPILAAGAAGMGAPPLLLMLPATLAASAAFMLPVATPPNAIIFASHRVTIGQMARAGIWLNLLAAPVLALLCWWLAPLLMD